MMDASRGAFSDWSTKLGLARLESYDVQTDAQTKEAVLDQFGNTIATGLLNIVLLDGNAPRKKVPFVLPCTGNTMYVGGMPEIGTMCVVGWRQQNQPVIVGFLPYGVDQMVRKRQTIPNLAEGEVLLQSSGRTTDIEDTTNFFRGARVWLDRYGRCRIDTQDYDLIIGYLLSDEFTSKVAFKNDPITGESVFLREKIVGGTERRVDDKGNEVRQYGGTAYTRTGADVNVESQGSIKHVAFKGQEYGDRLGNKVEVTVDGIVRLSAPAGSLEFSTQGSQKVQVAGSIQKAVLGSLIQTIGDRYSTIIGGSVDTEIAGGVEEVVTGGDVVHKITDGSWQTFAENGIDLETTDASPLKLGSTAADEAVVLGDTLRTALNELTSILQTAPGIGFGNLGSPVPLNPAIVSALAVWVSKYLSAVTTNIVSGKVFTERGPVG